MAELILHSPLLDLRASRGIVKDFSFENNPVTQSQTSARGDVYKILKDMWLNDPVINTAISTTVDVCTFNGYDFVGKTTPVEKARKLFNETLDFDQVLDNFLYQLLIMQDAFLELKYSGDKVIEVWPLETTEMRIVYDKHGDVKEYVQVPDGARKEDWTHFGPEEVIHVALHSIGSGLYSANSFQSISRSFATKVRAHDYLSQIFTNLPPKAFYVLENANADQFNKFQANLIRAKSNPHVDLVTQGKADSKINQVNFDTGLNSVLQYLRTEMLMLTRVPPIWVGIPDDSNRSNAEAQIFSFETRVRKIQQKVASAMNRKLMPKLGLDTVEFKFNPISFQNEKSLIEIARQMKDMGFKSENVVDYLKYHGFPLEADAEIETPELGVGGVKNIDTMPSRVRMNKQTDKMANNMNEQGASDAGKAQAQMRKQVGET